MTNYVDLDDLKSRVYFETATVDDRYTWEEITPDPAIAQTTYDQWTDGFRRFRLTGCAHRAVDRDGELCTHCGHAFPYSPHTVWETEGTKKAAAKKTAAKRAPRKPRGTK